MNEIEKGEFFELKTDNQVNAFRFILKELKAYGQLDKGMMVKKLHDEEIYSQRLDCKKFIKNCIKSCNLQIRSESERKIKIRQEKVVKSE